MGKYLHFFDNFSKIVFKIYCAFKTEKIVNHKHFAIFSFFYLRFIRGRDSDYFGNSFSEADIS